MRVTAIADLLAARAEATCAHLLPNGTRKGREWLAGSVSGEAGSSLHVILEGPRSGMWRDFAGADTDKGDLMGLWQKTRNVDLPTACREAQDWLQVPEAERNNRSGPRHPRPEQPYVPDQRWTDLQAAMRPGTRDDLEALRVLRRLPVTCGLELATQAGQLWFGVVHDSGERHPAWILTDGSRRHAQARKMDGSLWHFGGGHKSAKSKTIWGTQSGWPVGINEVNTPEIMLVEGAPDFLAAWHFIWAHGRQATTRPVAMFGASNSISAPAHPLFAGRRVRVFPHADAAGQKAGTRWATTLRQAGATVSIYDFAKHRVKDLNELVIAGQVFEEGQV